MGSTSVDLGALMQEYQPQPIRVKPLCLDISDAWPADWYERTVLAPRGPDAIVLNAAERPVQSGTLGRLADGQALPLGIGLDAPIRACFLGDCGAAPDPRTLPPSLLRRAGLLGLGPGLGASALPWLARVQPALAGVDAERLAALEQDHLLLWSDRVHGEADVPPPPLIMKVRLRPPAAWVSAPRRSPPWSR